MNIIEAFKKYEKIRRKLWIPSDTYICTKHLTYSHDVDSNDLKIYIKRQGREELEPYALLGFSVMADDWEEYIEKPKAKKRNVIDCFSNDFFNEKCVKDIESEYLNKGWETIYQFHSKLAMVKYED